MTFLNKLIPLFAIVLLTACNFTENLEINNDGSGTFSVALDGSGLMVMTGDQMGKMIEKHSSKKVIDSVFSVKKFLNDKKDSIAKLSPQERENLKKLENFEIHVKMDALKNQFMFSMDTPFQKITELENVMDNLRKLKALKGKNVQDQMAIPLGDDFGNNNAKINFAYTGASFSRTAKLLGKKIQRKKETDSLGMLKMVFAGSSYTLKYHFPKRVKTVSNPDALFSADKKTITVNYPFVDYMDNPDKLNLKVEFEE